MNDYKRLFGPDNIPNEDGDRLIKESYNKPAYNLFCEFIIEGFDPREIAEIMIDEIVADKHAFRARVLENKADLQCKICGKLIP